MLTEHPVQIPAVAASVLPAEAVASTVPAVSEPAAVPAVASPEESAAADASETAEGDAAAPAKRRRSRRSGRGHFPVRRRLMPLLTQLRRKRVKRPFLMSP